MKKIALLCSIIALLFQMKPVQAQDYLNLEAESVLLYALDDERVLYEKQIDALLSSNTLYQLLEEIVVVAAQEDFGLSNAQLETYLSSGELNVSSVIQEDIQAGITTLLLTNGFDAIVQDDNNKEISMTMKDMVRMVTLILKYPNQRAKLTYVDGSIRLEEAPLELRMGTYNEMRLLAVVVNDTQGELDLLIEEAMQTLARTKAISKGQTLATLPIAYALGRKELLITASDDVYAILPQNLDRQNLTMQVFSEAKLEAPLAKDVYLGEVVISYDGSVISTLSLYSPFAVEDFPPLRWWESLTQNTSQMVWLGVLFGGILVVGWMLFIVRKR
ncbi:MAG: hypothetical protein ACRCZJ_04015 [Erysipelotrichaceae bacterium]